MSEYDRCLDASGLDCPMPLLKMKLALNEMAAGEVIKVMATDRGSERDFKAFCDLADHKLLEFENNGDKLIYLIQKSS